MARPMVALVGRPNVGKSTLFNRMVGRRLAVVDGRPGTTRDRLQAECEWNGVSFTVVDTGGIDALPFRGDTDPLAEDSVPFISLIRAQAELAIAEADVIIFLTDAAAGLTPADEEVADILRRSDKPIILAANKAESPRVREAAVEFYALGLDGFHLVSALHGQGVADLLDRVVEVLPEKEEEPEAQAVRLAIVGRPNVGKSSLLNQLLGEERVIVSPVPGTTRDAIDTPLEWAGIPLVLIDTAGIRRRGKIRPGVERYSVLRALRAIKRADVALLMIDATEGVTSQDAHVASFILDEWCGVVVLVNKWDLVEKDTYTMEDYTAHVLGRLRFMDYVPVLFISALTGQRVDKVIPEAMAVQQARHYRIPTAELNRLIQEAVARHAPSSKHGRRLRIYYASQPEVAPPTFVLHVNDPSLAHFSYRRYLENRLREHYPYVGVPLRLILRRRDRRERSNT